MGWLLTTTGHLIDEEGYTLIETAKFNGIEPYAYRLAVFIKRPGAKAKDWP